MKRLKISVQEIHYAEYEILVDEKTAKRLKKDKNFFNQFCNERLTNEGEFNGNLEYSEQIQDSGNWESIEDVK